MPSFLYAQHILSSYLWGGETSSDFSALAEVSSTYADDFLFLFFTTLYAYFCLCKLILLYYYISEPRPFLYNSAIK